MAVWLGLTNKARRHVGWSTVVEMGNYSYVKIQGQEFGLREWVDNVDKEVWREVVQDVKYGDTGPALVWTCLEKIYPDTMRAFQWEITIR